MTGQLLGAVVLVGALVACGWVLVQVWRNRYGP